VWLGPGAADAAATLGAHGATRVHHWDSADAKGFVTVPQVEALEQLVAATSPGRRAVRLVEPREGRRGTARPARRRRRDHRRDRPRGRGGPLVATKEVFGGDVITTVAGRRGQPAVIGIASTRSPVEEVGGAAADGRRPST
jgi:electron transfer flavoprotein alpha subunit